MSKNFVIIFLALISFFAGCGFQIGPAFPKRDGRFFLAEQGYDESLIETVLTGGRLEHWQIVELSKSKSPDVRFLIARNCHLTHEEIDLFIKDSCPFVRSGAACNINLSVPQIERLLNDRSHTVYCKLAHNPSLSEEILLRIHKEHSPGLLYFAKNTNCPQEIREQIRQSDDDLAKHHLALSMRRKAREEKNAK